MGITKASFNLFSFDGRFRILHLSWIAFFISFVVWFNHAPLLASLRATFGLTDQQINILLILNVSLTIPARIVVGMLVDSLGPRIVYSGLLILTGLCCFYFASADDFQTLALARFLLGFAGAGFVIGIRMIGEWFPARQAGLAQGIYAGWGNFGSAAAAIALPSLALAFGGDQGWRYAVASTGILALGYAFLFYMNVRDTPEGSSYFRPNKTGGLEVASRGDFFFCLIMQVPLYLALGVLAWKLQGLGLLASATVHMIYIGLTLTYLYQCWRMYQVNANIFIKSAPQIHRYRFKQVAILSLAYFVTFGSELAVVSMLPLFLMETFKLSQVTAGFIAAPFGLIVLFARPLGGWVSDQLGRKLTLSVVMAGLSLGYFLMSRITNDWALPMVVATIISCALFVHLGTGAVFAMVPLVQRRLTGQIAGMAGAYGNVGGVTFLTVLSFVSPQSFFLVIAGTAVAILVAVLFLDEPEGAMVEVLPDGTVQLIEVT
jgi:NNP family nitrate/nitrite transporter-like MFS transporter